MRYHVLDAARERAMAPLATRVDVFDASCAVDGGVGCVDGDVSRGVNERFASGFKISARGSYGVAYDAHARAFIVYDGAMGDGDAQRPLPAMRAVRCGEGCYDWAWSSGGWARRRLRGDATRRPDDRVRRHHRRGDRVV